MADRKMREPPPAPDPDPEALYSLFGGKIKWDMWTEGMTLQGTGYTGPIHLGSIKARTLKMAYARFAKKYNRWHRRMKMERTDGHWRVGCARIYLEAIA